MFVDTWVCTETLQGKLVRAKFWFESTNTWRSSSLIRWEERYLCRLANTYSFGQLARYFSSLQMLTFPHLASRSLGSLGTTHSKGAHWTKVICKRPRYSSLLCLADAFFYKVWLQLSIMKVLMIIVRVASFKQQLLRKHCQSHSQLLKKLSNIQLEFRTSGWFKKSCQSHSCITKSCQFNSWFTESCQPDSC